MPTSEIIPVIARPESQGRQVDELVDYCRRLDGTEIKVIPISDEGYVPPYIGNRHGCIAARSLRIVAKEMQGPFLWLEHDSVPLKPGWLKAISEEYCKLGKPFMISGDSQPPFDIVGGIGVYDPRLTLEKIPEAYPRNSWDLWMVKNIPELISKTHLIQHTYARYARNGNYEPHRFPRDSSIVRSDAVLFHSDKFHELMRKDLPKRHAGNRFLHRGKIGDIIAALPSIKALGGGELVITDKKVGGCATPISPSIYSDLEPLLLRQPYLKRVSFETEPTDITHDFTGFQYKVPWHNCNSLIEWQAEFIGAHPETVPWLEGVKPNRAMKKRVIISRSERYHNPRFPWREVLERLGESALFLGLPHEHEAFIHEFGCPSLECYYPANLLEVASAIAGAKLFIGNQSSPFWIAAGLGVPLIQEVWPERCDSIVLRENALYPQSDFDFSRLLKNLLTYTK